MITTNIERYLVIEDIRFRFLASFLYFLDSFARRLALSSKAKKEIIINLSYIYCLILKANSK